MNLTNITDTSIINNATNYTIFSPTESCLFPMAYKVTVSSLLGFTGLVSPMLNSIVCYTIFSVKELQTFGNILIANLSLCDIIISLFLPSLEVIYVSFYPKWPLGKVGTYVLNCAWMFSLATPFVIVTVLTAERFKTLKSLIPIRSAKVILVTVLCLWLYCISSVVFMALYFIPPGDDVYEWNVKPEYYYSFLAIHVVIPLVVILFLYVSIFRMTRSSRRNTTKHGATSASLSKREMKVAKTIGIVIGLMFAIWIPALVLEYFYAIGTESCVVQMAGPVSVWLSCSNGLVNPLLYFYRNPILRSAIIKKLPKTLANCFISGNSRPATRAAGVVKTNQGFQKDFSEINSTVESTMTTTESYVNKLETSF